MYKHYFKQIPSVQAIFSTRHGGQSPEPYSGLNLGLNTGDDREIVQENRNRLFSDIGFKSDQCAFSGQIHSDHIEIVIQPGININTDALITNQRNLPLVIQAADCACVFLYDPQTRVIAAVHSGWRGTVQKIVPKTIAKMRTEFSVNPAQLLAVISPCISSTVFEVGRDVYEQFDSTYFTQKNESKWLLDLKSVLNDQLIQIGVQSIETDPDCTYLNQDDYFSYRRDGNNSGRMMGIIWLG